ncbi:MAG: hypothetical protein KJP00_11130 [Bacteroidia bacterium]|nr:hypothetical protein [Bacteroidia bacterium]
MQKKNKSRLTFMIGVDFLIKHTPYIIFLGFLSLLYIGNVHRTNRTIREINQAKAEIVESRNIYMATKCDLIKSSKQTEVARKLELQGFKDAYRKPSKVLVSR